MAQSSRNRASGWRVLVAEDEPHIRRVLETLLDTSGFTVDVVCDGSAALERLKDPEQHYDLLLSDLMMPGHTGLELLDEVSRLPHRSALPVVILTARGQDADRQRALALGAADFLTKPFSPKKLLGRIIEIVDARA